jgi:hypothetical protein
VASERSGTPLAKKFFKLFEGWPSDTGPDSYRDISLHLFGIFTKVFSRPDLMGLRSRFAILNGIISLQILLINEFLLNF